METLHTSEQTLAAILAVAANAEKDFNQSEQTAIAQIGEALDYPTLLNRTAIAIEQVRPLSGVELANFLIETAKAVEKDEQAYIMEAVLQVIFADKELAFTEANNLLIIANALEMSHDIVLLMLADFIKENSDITIKFEA